MQTGRIALQIRAANTRFGNKVAGAAEFALAVKNTLQSEMAFVIHLGDSAETNQHTGAINQRINERFAVIVAVANDAERKDRTGITAIDSIDTVRAEIFGAILNWQMTGAESVISYVGGRILDINPAYLWYQFEFVVTVRISDEDGYDNDYDSLGYLNEIYTQMVLDGNTTIGLPIDFALPELDTLIAVNREYESGFSKAFSTIEGNDNI